MACRIAALPLTRLIGFDNQLFSFVRVRTWEINDLHRRVRRLCLVNKYVRWSRDCLMQSYVTLPQCFAALSHVTTSEAPTNVSHFSVVVSDSVRLHFVALSSSRDITIRVLGSPFEGSTSRDLSPGYSPRSQVFICPCWCVSVGLDD